MKFGSAKDTSRRALAPLAEDSSSWPARDRDAKSLQLTTLDEDDVSEAMAMLEFLSHDSVEALSGAIARRLQYRVSSSELMSIAGVET